MWGEGALGICSETCHAGLGLDPVSGGCGAAAEAWTLPSRMVALRAEALAAAGSKRYSGGRRLLCWALRARNLPP